MSYFIVEVDALAGRETAAARLADLAGHALASFGQALLDRAGRGSPVDEDSAAGDVVIGTVVVDAGSGPRAWKWRDGAVARQLDRLRAGKLEELSVTYTLPDVGLTRRRFELVAMLHEEDSDMAKALNVLVTDAWPGARGAFEAWVPGFFRRAAVDLDAATGYVTHDDSGGVSGSPYETWASHSFAWALAEADEKLRGYYWANLLGPRHVERLGGLDTLRAALPRAAFEPLTPSGYPLLLELPGTPSTVAWDDRDRLREVFAPLLEPPRRGYSDRPPGAP